MLNSGMLMCLTCIVIGAFFLVAFLLKCKDKRSVTGVFLKNATSIFFILTAVCGIVKNSASWKYGLLIVVGLVFGMLGDIYLDQKWVYPKDMKQYLYAGFICFGIGHLFYIPALVMTAHISMKLMIIPVIVGVAVAVGNLLLEKPMKQKFGQYKAIVTVYSFILAAMVATAVVAAFVSKHPAFIVYAIGSVLFLVSDLVLSPMYFGEGKNTPTNFIVNHVTYYLGQYMIAFSVALLTR